MASGLTDSQLKTLRALCDTYVPSLKVSPDPLGFWARAASDLAVDREIAGYLTTSVPPAVVPALLGLLDALAAKGFLKVPQSGREGILAQLSRASPDAAGGLKFFERQTLLFHYGLPASPDPDRNMITYGSPAGQNPNWEVMGYPGPVSVAPRRPKRIQTLRPANGSLDLEADVCVIGSGAGGAVVAARLAREGRQVVVLEAGGHYNSADFPQLELWGYRHLWYRGGATPTADGNVALLAGATLGGGTEINWMNCVRTPDVVRRDWARDFGLYGVDTPEFDRYLDTVETRLSASPRNALFNSQNLRMREGCEKLGYRSAQTHVNWDSSLFNPLMAGYTGFGDQTGGKQTARRTYLRDAYENGARFVVNCRADRILVERGRATGVEATYSTPDGRRAAVKVRAPQVVVAGGSLESPALLLRSGIGGPAVGRHLHLQPGGAIYAVYQEKQKGWWGTPMSANCEEFTDTGGGYGFYMEIPAFGPGFVASVIPWSSGRQHKETITKVPYISTFIFFLRDRSDGQVSIDSDGNSVATYSLDDPVDQSNFRRAGTEAVRIHKAAGALEIMVSLSGKQITWKRGGNLNEFLRTVGKLPVLNGAQPMISAHQLSTCRMGLDRATSVANPDGELHDVKGVWVADASACPTALGANPMITIMALAERTAIRIAAAGHSSWNSLPAWAGVSTDSGAIGMAASVMRGAMAASAAPANALMRMLSMGERLMTSAAHGALLVAEPAPLPPPARERTPMYSHVIELQSKPGQAKALVNAIRDRAIPEIIRPSEGFIDELVLLSDTDTNHVTAISFWRSKPDGERFFANGFAKVSVLLQPYLSALPQRREFLVGASTNCSITGW